jgi:fructoselysine transporter
MANPLPHLDRKLGLFQSTAINMIDMVGIGPFIVMPMVIKMMGGPQFIFAWIAGAVLSLIDGMIWSELGAAFPLAGGSYNFLKEAYGKKWGRLFSFLFVWQTLLLSPLVAASGAIGFAQYCTYLYNFSAIQQKFISGGLIILIVFLLYRNIQSIGKISSVLWFAVISTICWIIIGGATHHSIVNEWIPSTGDFSLQLFFVALGQASVKTVYSYLGYYNVCHLGGEIKNPGKNIPRSIFISVIGISVLYIVMNISIVSVVPWQEAQNSSFIVSSFIEKLYGHTAAMAATMLVLIVAFSSLFAVLLGYSRIPYAAAVDGIFFKVFSKIHPTKHFPYVSLLFLGSLAFFFSLLFRLGTVISAILAMRILIQFVAQAAGVVLLRKKFGKKKLPFKMPFYPMPVIIAIIVWLLIFRSTGIIMMIYSLLIISAGIIVYFISERFRRRKLSEISQPATS